VRVLGLHAHKGALRWAVVEGTRENPVRVDHGRLVTPDPAQVPALMDWYESQFGRLIDDFSPEKIAYRLTLEPSKEQLFFAEFPFGVLNLISHRRGLPITCLTARSFTASRLGLPRDANIHAACDNVFGQHPPYWDDHQRYALLLAWFEVGDV
jgi:hypothetical protein